MARKYASTLTSKITPDNWKDQINLKDLDLDDLTDLIGDFKTMEKLGKQLGGFLKEAFRARLPEDEDFYEGTHFQIQFNPRARLGGLDEERITEEMGEDWVATHRKPGIEYTEMRVNAVEAS